MYLKRLRLQVLIFWPPHSVQLLPVVKNGAVIREYPVYARAAVEYAHESHWADEINLHESAEQLARDIELNQQRQQQELKKQLLAQVKQLIEKNKLARDEDGVAYRFTDDNKVKTLYVAETMRVQLISGRLAIVKSGKSYEVITADIAKKISERDADSVLLHNEPAASVVPADDPYAGYAVPDDLMW